MRPSNAIDMTPRFGLLGRLALVMTIAASVPAAAQTALSGTPLHIARTTGAIVIDGAIDDEGWRGAEKVDVWFETNPGDNTEPAVKNLAYLTYDDRFFYAAFDLEDPDPSAIRSPYADHDRISGNSTDYAGVILDTRNDGHSAVLLLASATGIQYDAVTDDDGSGEDSSPDFFWESAARRNARGWTLELRVPFSSLRYRNVDPQKWGILLYRNYPRAFRYQFFSARLPRGGNCFICRANTLLGLEKLPSGGHIVAAPYATASQTAKPVNGPGSALEGNGFADVGLDVKWTPSADNAIDLTLNPDFSQVESDTAQISANERFALSFPEKRPFFLEGVELFSTPMRAVYTRAITAPRWGSRITGKSNGFNYTMLVSDDQGGGKVVVPGPQGSTNVDQNFSSTVAIARVKKSFGRNSVSALVTDREGREGSGWSRLAGPDLQWRPSSNDTVTAQWLESRTLTPDRPDLSDKWTGNEVGGSAFMGQWARNTRHFDITSSYRDLDQGFRADAGFIPQVGYRQAALSTGWTVRPRGKFYSRERTFFNFERQIDDDGALLSRLSTYGFGMDTRYSGFMQYRFMDDRVLSGGRIFSRRRVGYVAQFSPSRVVQRVSVDGTLGDEIDFDNSRKGAGATVNANAQFNPTDHLELSLVQNVRYVDVDLPAANGRLFTARVSRVRGTYQFNAKSFVRVITQYVNTQRNLALYTVDKDARTATLSGSVLLAYKINWQSVLFVGYGDNREFDTTLDRLAPSDHQFFVKVSYAFQR